MATINLGINCPPGSNPVVYVLAHPGSGFTGFSHGVDFVNGVGTTGSRQDRDFLVNTTGCTETDTIVFKTDGVVGVNGLTRGAVADNPAVRSCELRIERNGLLSLRLFDGRRYVIDLTASGLGNEAGTNRAFLELTGLIDRQAFDQLIYAGYQARLDFNQDQPKG